MQGFEFAYRRYRDVVIRFAMQCVGRRDIAEEITADAFLRLHENWKTIEPERLPGWLFAVVKNRAADHWRRAGLEKRYIEQRPADQPYRGEPLTGLFEDPALKPVHRICLTLRYVQEMTVPEIAGRLGLSEIQVKGHLQYARSLLRRQLSPEAPNE
ncbi:MAG: sigma-70 family RNA polymerase sigma factor [Bryobacterales bacterium]|nr:sigma-70 family RNA polymerase sigma factor [Bryobacterales bacterium]